MRTAKPTIGILGIGNLLLGDEGFGVHFIDHLPPAYHRDEQLKILDGGTSGIMLTPFIEELEYLFVIDTISLPDEPGSIHCLSEGDVRSSSLATSMSPHQLGLLETIDLCRLRGNAPEKIKFITIVPGNLATGVDLSPRLVAGLDEVMNILRDSLAELGNSPRG